MTSPASPSSASADPASPPSARPADQSSASPSSPGSPVDAASNSFADLGITPVIVGSLTRAGFDHPFPIQHLAIPIALQGSDLIGQARTGTGKTLAFGVPIMQRIVLPGDDGYEPSLRETPQALVLCPTRELALQVASDLEVAGQDRGARVLTVYGGVGYEPQLDSLSDGVDVVVGTPGRLLDLMHRTSLVLTRIKILVLDEADEMLDLGFLPDVERLIAQTPKSRQTMLFSATMPPAIVSLSRAHLKQPIIIRAEAFDEQMTVPETTQFVYQAHDLDKPAIIGKLLQSPSATKVMIFCRTKRGVQRLTDDLVARGFKATCIHGDLSQILRERALEKFRQGKAQVIVATDVAARGIDVESVSHVVNYDCPDDEKSYVHRIGRTGRAGHEGVAVTLVDWADLARWKFIDKALGLDFETPLEAYSTTPQLLSELDIPPDATGWLVTPEARPARPRETIHRTRSDHPGDRERRGRRDDRQGERERRVRREDTAAAPARQRTRRRNGVVVSGGETAETAAPQPAASARTTPSRRRRGRPAASADRPRPTGEPAGDSSPAPQRRRRRTFRDGRPQGETAES
ncbi:MAG: DEAD/DEAH box helicase [Propionibacteriaceae bacterium]|jgi:superfamily II DNA/RNA helicase|nr:DEAD/DEAH box helicase [Propionibacteriaceae bacterium]